MTAEPELFDQIPPTTLPPATVVALQEITCEAKRDWITSILTSAVVRKIPLEVLQRSLVAERLDPGLIARILDPLRSGAAT